MEINRILLTNDDGFHAEGLQTLYRHLKDLVEVTIVAPDRERSAVGHGITMHQPLRVVPFQLEERSHWIVDGTPADCVKIALDTLLKDQKPDLIISGINRGPNMGSDVLYSGTVSAAMEGSMYHLPSIATSLAGFGNTDFNPAAAFIASNFKQIGALAVHSVLNINFPVQKNSTGYQGIKYTRLGCRVYENVFEERTDPRGRVYYWMGGEIIPCEQGDDTDVYAVEHNFISITPLHSDLTDYNFLKTNAAAGESILNSMKFAD
ncbi:MAG TPA: 5'/3'-nucleotidase SurE [Bacillota bacterium]|nr:5'/3'-nucleotidase SurE [Bacillota bacterium]